MTPTLQPGDYLIGWAGGRRRPGQIVVFQHPHRPGFWLVKRVETVDGDRMSVRSDAPHLTTADSRTFGSVPVGGSYRVAIRYHRSKSPP